MNNTARNNMTKKLEQSRVRSNQQQAEIKRLREELRSKKKTRPKTKQGNDYVKNLKNELGRKGRRDMNHTKNLIC